MTIAARPVIPVERYGQRLRRAQAATAARGLAALLVGVGPDLRYFTGYDARPLERLTMLILPAAGTCRLLVPRLEADPARRAPAGSAGLVDIVTWSETERPHEIVAGIVRETATTDAARVAVSGSLPALHLLRLQTAMPGLGFELGSSVMRELRVIKDADEIELLRLAAEAADRVVARVGAGPLVGRTERELEHEVRERLVDEGHERAEFAIVGSGPNSASPHHEASDRVIAAAEPIVLDIGGVLGGYGSDITRTIWVTGGHASKGPDPEFARIFELVREAQVRATRATRPGIAAGELDAIARRTISDGGYGDNFIHRLGHGIGLEGHEDPYLVSGNTETLAQGMAFSIEPGIYLEGRFGCRLEDIVVCGSNGPVVLNQAPHELLVVDG
jgi:Xaa-Pro aminopeptidase